MQTNSVLNTVAASAADISMLARKLNVAITSTTGAGTFPTMRYSLIESAQVLKSLIETANNYKFSYTAADNTDYSFTVIQTVNGKPVQFTAELLNSGVGATATTIGNALVAKFNGAGMNVTCTHTGTNAYVTVVGNAGSPLFVGLSGTNVTAALNQAGVSIASCTAATPTVCTTGSAHGLVVGNTITITSADDTKLASGTYRVRTIPSSTTFTMANPDTGVVITASATTTATVVIVAQAGRGQGADLAAAGVSGAASGTQYSSYIFTYGFDTPGAGNTLSRSAGSIHTLYVAEGTSSTSPTTNFGNFDVRMREIYNDFVASATTADPQTAKLANV